MYVTALRSGGYRNLEGKVELCQPLAVLIGENNAGPGSNRLNAATVPGHQRRTLDTLVIGEI